MFCCLKGCLDTLGYSNNVPMRVRENPVRLDTSHMGMYVLAINKYLVNSFMSNIIFTKISKVTKW